MVQASEAVIYRLPDEVRVDFDSGPGLDPSILQNLDAADFAADHQTSEALVGNQNIRALAQKKGGDVQLSCVRENHHKVVGCRGAKEEVGRTSDPECGEWCQGNVLLHRTRPQGGFETPFQKGRDQRAWFSAAVECPEVARIDAGRRPWRRPASIPLESYRRSWPRGRSLLGTTEGARKAKRWLIP